MLEMEVRPMLPVRLWLGAEAEEPEAGAAPAGPRGPLAPPTRGPRTREVSPDPDL